MLGDQCCVTPPDLTWLIRLVRAFRFVDGIEDGLLLRCDSGSECLAGAVDSDGGRVQGPESFWTVLEMARAVNIIVRCASIASQVRWNMGLARRSALLIRKDLVRDHQLRGGLAPNLATCTVERSRGAIMVVTLQ